MSESERVVRNDDTAPPSVDDERGIPNRGTAAQPPTASLTQAGRFLVLDREERVADGELERCSQLPGRRLEAGPAPATRGEGKRLLSTVTRQKKEATRRRRSPFSLSLSLSLSLFRSLRLSHFAHTRPSPSRTHMETSQISAVAGGRQKRRVSLPKERKAVPFFLFSSQGLFFSLRGLRERTRCFCSRPSIPVASFYSLSNLFFFSSVPFASILPAPLDTLRSLK